MNRADPDIKERFSRVVEQPVGFLDKQVGSSSTTLDAIICTAVVTGRIEEEEPKREVRGTIGVE